MKRKICFFLAFLWLFTNHVFTKVGNAAAAENKPLMFRLVDYTKDAGVWKCFYDDRLINVIEEETFPETSMTFLNGERDHVFIFSVFAICPGHGFLNFSFFENETEETPILYMDISYEIDDLLRIICIQTEMVLYEDDAWIE